MRDEISRGSARGESFRGIAVRVGYIHTTVSAGVDALVHRPALEPYLTTYGSPGLPPSRLLVETLTIGQSNTVYRNLGRRADKSAVAASIGVTAPVLESWLSTCVRVRVRAHHTRLWNVGNGVYPAIPTSRTTPWVVGVDALPERSRRRLYPVLVSLQALREVVSPRSGWAARLHELLDTRPRKNLAGMGVPENWEHDNFWSRHLA